MAENVAFYSPRSQGLNNMPSEVRPSISIGGVHKGISLLITSLGFLLPLIQGPKEDPLLVTHYSAILTFTVVLFLYIGSLTSIFVRRLQAPINFDPAAQFMNKICILLGTLASLLLFFILFPLVGRFALFLWTIWFLIRDITMSYQYLKSVYQNAAARLVRTFDRLKEMIIVVGGHLVEYLKRLYAGAVSVLVRTFNNLKELITIVINGRFIEQEAEDRNNGLPAVHHST